MPIPDSVTPEHVVAAARSWLGTPWRHQGRVKGRAVDCAGLIVGVGRELGLLDVDYRAYGRIPDGRTLRALCDEHLEPVPGAGPGGLPPIPVGGVLLMAFAHLPQHLAIVGDRGDPAPAGARGQVSIIHAYAAARRCIEHRLDYVWAARIRGVYRFRGVAPGPSAGAGPDRGPGQA